MAPDQYNRLPKSAVTGFTPIDFKPQPEPGFKPILPRIREIPTATDGQSVLTNLDGTQVKIEKFHGGSIVSAIDWSFDALSCPSEEAVASQQPGQDCLGVIGIINSVGHDILLVVQADGVGSAYNSEIAASVAVRSICENGTEDLHGNLSMAAERIKGFDTNRPTSGPDLLQQALNRTRTEFGTHTTVNQLQIDQTSGRYSDLGLGDGSLVISRASGAVEKYEQGHNSSRLTSRNGLEGTAITHEGSLSPGDTILMFSDGFDKLDDKAFSKLAKLSGSELQREIELLIPSLRDDDRSIFRYIHSK